MDSGARALWPRTSARRSANCCAEEFKLIRNAELRLLFPDRPRPGPLRARPRAAYPLPGARHRPPIRSSASCWASPRSIRCKHDLLFSRFVSEERDEPPDIDVDFEHERREEVMQYIYERYGRHRAGIAATVIHYRPRSAMREVGKALGLSEDVTARLVGHGLGQLGRRRCPEKRLAEAGFDPDNPEIERLQACWSTSCSNFPRHLSQHVGGFVLTEDRLDETVPIHNGGDGRPHLHRMGQGRHRRARADEGRCARARHAHLHPQGFDLMRAHGLGDHDLKIDPEPRIRSGLRHAVQGRQHRRLPGRKPRPDQHAAAAQAAQRSTTSTSRSRSSGRGRSRATWSIPICGGAARMRPSNIPRPARRTIRRTSCKIFSARPSACRCSRNRR